MILLDETGRFLYTKYGKSEEGVQTLGEKIIHGIHRFLEILDSFLSSITSLVVAVEFVKMLLRPTVGNTLELLIMALSRYVVLNHHEPLSLAVGIAGVVALFATRRFLSGRPQGGKDDRISTEIEE